MNNNNKNKNLFTRYEIWKNNKPYVKGLPLEKQWKNSIFLFNKNKLANVSTYDKIIAGLSNGFYNMFRLKLEKKVRKTNFHLMRKRFKRFSFKRIFVSRPEVKHSIDKVLLTFYVYNRQKTYLLNKIKNLQIRNLQKLRNSQKVRKLRGWRKRRLLIYRNKKRNLINKLIKLGSYKNEYILNKTFTLLSFNTNESILKKLENLKSIKRLASKLVLLTSATNKHINLYNKKHKKIKKNYYTRLFIKETLNNYYKLLYYVNRCKFNETYLIKLGALFSQMYNKKVEFNIVNLKYFYQSSDIMTQAVKYKLKNHRKNRVVRVLRVFINKVTIPKIKVKLLDLNSDREVTLPFLSVNKKLKNFKLNYHKNIDKKKQFINLTAYKIISGVKMEASGRLTKRFVAARAISKSRQKGSLRDLRSSYKGFSSEMLRNQFKSNMDMTQMNYYVRTGSFGLKGWLAHF